MKVFVVGYKVYGDSACDVVKIFYDKIKADKFADKKNGEHKDTSVIGYVVVEFEIE